MAVGIDMFGAGGEGLGGLFVGNQMAMQRDQAEMERQKALVDMANTQQITEQRRLGNEYEGAILGDKIQQFKDAATQKKEEAQLERFNRQGEQFGRLGQMLSGVPGPARQAALRQMAGQAGIAEDNPLFQQFMTADPEALPDIMNKFSQGFYEQGDKAKAELLKREEMRKLAEQQAIAKAEEGRLNREQKAELVRETNQLRRDLASQASADRRAAIGQRAEAASARGAGGKAPTAPTTDKAIASLILNDPNMSEEEKLAALQQHVYNKTVVGKEETTADIMGTRKPLERAAEAAGGKPQTKAGAAGGTGKPQVGEVRKGYTYKGGDPSKPTSWEKVK